MNLQIPVPRDVERVWVGWLRDIKFCGFWVGMAARRGSFVRKEKRGQAQIFN